MKEDIKGEFIGFRINAEAYQRIEQQAHLRGEGANEWCRNLALSESSKNFGLTAGERVLFEQIAVVRHLLGRLLRESLPAEEFAKLKREVAEHAGGIAQGLLSKSRAARESRPQAAPSEVKGEGNDDRRSEPVH